MQPAQANRYRPQIGSDGRRRQGSSDLRVGGSLIDLVRFFSLFDKAPGTFAIVTP